MQEYIVKFSPILMVILTIPLAVILYRMIVSENSRNSVLILDVLTSLTIAVGALATVGTGWSGFLGIGFGIALTGFMATCLLAIFPKRRSHRR